MMNNERIKGFVSILTSRLSPEILGYKEAILVTFVTAWLFCSTFQKKLSWSYRQQLLLKCFATLCMVLNVGSWSKAFSESKVFESVPAWILSRSRPWLQFYGLLWKLFLMQAILLHFPVKTTYYLEAKARLLKMCFCLVFLYWGPPQNVCR